MLIKHESIIESQMCDDMNKMKDLIKQWFSARKARAQKDIMSKETRDYGEKWVEKLETIALDRAMKGVFPREFCAIAINDEERDYHKTISDDIFSKYNREREKHQEKPKSVVVLIGGGGAAGKTTFSLKPISD